MSGSPARRPGVEDLVDAYRADLTAAGMFAGHPVTSVARMFFIRTGAEGWSCLPLAAQCALPLKDRRVVGWLIVTRRLRPSADYLVACRPYLGEIAAHHHRAFHARFSAASAGLGFGIAARARHGIWPTFLAFEAKRPICAHCLAAGGAAVTPARSEERQSPC